MGFEPIHSEAQLQAHVARPACMVLFGGAHCGVCQAIRPRLQALIAARFADIALAYVDCEQAPAVCAQHSVFSLPVLRLYLDGQLALERARSFSLLEVEAELARLHALWRGDPPPRCP